MAIGPFVLHAEFGQKSFVLRDKDVRAAMVAKMRAGVETMKRTGNRMALLVPGRFDESLAWDYQTANVVENLRACMEVCEPAGLILVLEPLNPMNHPGLFLTKIPQAYQICKAVGSPSCKIVDDMYHQQITEGNLIPNIDAAWDQIAAFHIGRQPGPRRADHGRDQLPEHLQVDPRQGIPGRAVHGARPEEARHRGRARGHRRLSGVRSVLGERRKNPSGGISVSAHWSLHHDHEQQRIGVAARLRQDRGRRVGRHGVLRALRRVRAGVGRHQGRRDRLRRARHRRRDRLPQGGARGRNRRAGRPRRRTASRRRSRA